MKWKIEYFSEIDSTQKYLLKKIEKEDLNYYCVWSDYQTNGIGTKNNKWVGKKGNLFLSFVINLKEFDFIPIQSLSIYFSFLVFEVLRKHQSNLLIKWPNDIYILDIEPKKVGGVLTNIKKKKIICGVGINTKFAPEIDSEYKSGCLDIKIKNDKIVKKILAAVEKKENWESIFFRYQKIFDESKKFFNIQKLLNKDGSLKG